MEKVESKFTVFYDAHFWVGVYERITDGKLEVCKITFGAEPKDYEVHDFILKNWYRLRFSKPVKANEKQDVKVNPKRMQRSIKKHLQSSGIGTKSQQALKLQQQETKSISKDKSRKQRDYEKQHQFELRQQKRKDKHRGR